MKKVIIIALLILLAFLNYISSQISVAHKPELYNEKNLINYNSREDEASAKYNFLVRYEADQKVIDVEEKIIWVNKSGFETSELVFALYANAYNDNSKLAKSIELGEDSRTRFVINELLVNGAEKIFLFKENDEGFIDSSIAVVRLENSAGYNDTLVIEVGFTLKAPKSIISLGYAAGRDFTFFSEWYPRLAVFEGGEWQLNPYHPFIDNYFDFADYNLTLELPSIYTAASNAEKISEEIDGNLTKHTFSIQSVKELVWFVSDDIRYFSKTIQSAGKNLKLDLYIQKENDNIVERYFTALESSISYLEKSLGEFPYKQLTLVNVPRTSSSDGNVYPGLITVKTDLISPLRLHEPERQITELTAMQYWYCEFRNNPSYDNWLNKGLSLYYSGKILKENFPKQLLSFHVTPYFPFWGINLLSYNEVPIIYILNQFEIPLEYYGLQDYYKNITIGDISENTAKHPTREKIHCASRIKPNLMLNILERELGEDEFASYLKKIFERNKYNLTSGRDFIEELKIRYGEKVDWIINHIYENSGLFDYKIRYLTEIEEGRYELFAERVGDGIAPVKIILNGESDSTYIDWDGKSRYEIFKISPGFELISAEIDPERKNLLDINFANNSYTIESKYWGSLSIAIRSFFWFQNALMILGSVG